jgi:hypothetical protein
MMRDAYAVYTLHLISEMSFCFLSLVAGDKSRPWCTWCGCTWGCRENRSIDASKKHSVAIAVKILCYVCYAPSWHRYKFNRLEVLVHHFRYGVRPTELIWVCQLGVFYICMCMHLWRTGESDQRGWMGANQNSMQELSLYPRIDSTTLSSNSVKTAQL